MKNSIMKGIVMILLVALCVCALSTTMVNKAKDDTVEFGKISSDNTIKKDAVDTTGTARVAQRILQAILTIAQVIGVGVAVIMLIVLAIKYISAAPSDKAEIKKHIVVYVVGAVVLLAACGILEIIKRFALMVDV